MDVKIRLLKISVINLGELMFEFSLAWVNPLSFLGKWIKFQAISCVGDSFQMNHFNWKPVSSSKGTIQSSPECRKHT